MKLNAVAQTTKKAESIIRFLFLMFVYSGCSSQANQTGSIQTCQQAEDAVKVAQQKFDDVVQQLAAAETGKVSTPDISVIQHLEEAQEAAFGICNRFS